VQVRKPTEGLPSITFGVAGQIGSLNGINAKGLAISTAALLDIPKTEQNTVGHLPIVLVNDLLHRAENIDDAVAMIRRLPKAGAFSLCLSHHASDRLCYVEFDGKDLKVLPTAPAVISANHRLMRTFAGEIPAASQHRLSRLRDLLGGDPPKDVSSERAQEVLRDRFDSSRGKEAASPNINTVRRVDNQISIIFQPGRGNLWVTAGPRSNGHQNEFLELKLHDLLPELAANSGEPQNNKANEAAPSFASTISRDQLLATYQNAESRRGNLSNVCERFVMRMVESQPLPAETPLAVSGGVVIVGDNPVASALKKNLEASGVHVLGLSTATSFESLLDRLESHWRTAPLPHLFLATAYDRDASAVLEGDGWEERKERGVMRPYQICQKWYQLMLADDRFAEGSIIALANLGGDFGFKETVPNVEGGALAGLVKGVALELNLARHVTSFRAKVVDAAPSMSPDEIAKAAIREWQAADGELETGYLGARRFVVRPVTAMMDAREGSLPEGGVFLITGGARGVTAEVAKALGLRTGAALHLIGSSPVPEVPEGYHEFSDQDLKDYKSAVMKEALASGQKPIDVWARFEKAVEIDRNLRSFADLGLNVTYHSCDIGDRDRLERLLSEIRRQSGPITGIIHGAGFERAASFEKKKIELVDATIRAKVDGAFNLMALTMSDPVRFFVMFGSVSGRFGGVGQTDYCLANEMLSKLGAWYRKQRPDCPVTTFHWHAWDDVGMAVRPESKHIAKLHNIKFMPAREGCEHLLDELALGLPEREIAVTELHYCREKYANTANLLASGNAVTRSLPFGLEAFPVLDSIITHEPKSHLVAELNLDPVGDVFLTQHRYKERPMMPVVMTLEALAEAAWLLAGEEAQVIGLKNIEILNGLRFHADDPQTARIHARASGRLIECDFTCDFYNRKGQLLLQDKPYLKTQVEVAKDHRPLTAPLPPEPSGWTLCWYPESELVIYHGPPFRCLREFAVEGEEGWGKIVAPKPSELTGRREGSRWVLPAALLDACFFSCGVVLWWHLRGVVAIPDGIEAVLLGRNPEPGEVCLVHITSRGRDGKLALFDFTVFGEDGTVVLQVEGYRNVIVAEAPLDVVS
jgi:NAD(P)-dependent dehydrogenase (short-subunit alcohol dehydrogenase family)